jgi:single-stranded DNA-binding protein
VDRNLTILTGTLVSAASRTIGQQGKSLVELKLAVSRPGRKGEGEQTDTIPVTIWSGDLGAAVLGLGEGTPCTVVARVSSREWNGKLYLELIGEHVTIGATMAASGEPVEAVPAEAPAVRTVRVTVGGVPAPDPAPAAAPARPGGPTRREPSVPF